MANEQQTLTAGQIAERLSETGDPAEVARIARQVKHWTNIGLLTPLGARHSGTGMPRRYSQAQLLKAALLSVLVRNYRLEAGVLEYISRTFDRIEEENALSGFLQLAEPTPELGHSRLAIPMRNGEIVGGLQFGVEADATDEAFRLGAQTALVIDWSDLVRRVFG